ncbi:MAG: DNA primase DnaG [Candidatus Woesearchaeota archaeon]
MGKISPIANKYIIHSSINIDGVVDRPDVIGAIFGQTEGLLGEDLELRELQRSGRIGRIEVNLDTSYGKTKGTIIIPSSLDKSETAIVGAALEIIQRIGPCNAKIRVERIEDVRVLKRNYVITRAKELLKNLMDNAMPDSQELSDEVATSVRVMEIQAWGKEKLPAGPLIDDSDEIILVEGRADVLVLLKHGFKNVIGMNGANVPETIISLCKQKIVTAFLDGDRGGDLNFQELTQVTEIDYVTKAPDGKEVEELTKKEIHKALRAKVSAEQAMMEYAKKSASHSQGDNRRRDYSTNSNNNRNNNQRDYQKRDNKGKDNRNSGRDNRDTSQRDNRKRTPDTPQKSYGAPKATEEEKDVFRNMIEDLVGTKGACVLDPKLNVLGKVPLSELNSTIKSFNEGVYAVILDGNVNSDLIKAAESANIKFLIGMDVKSENKSSKVSLMTINDL